MTFWQVADASPSEWTMQRSLSVPSAMALGELIHQICTISISKAHQIAETVHQWRDVSANELQSAGLSQKQAAKLLAAIELGKRALTAQTPMDNISDPINAAAALQYDLGFSSVEKAALLILNIKHNLIAKEIIAVGSRQECLIDPKVVFERILRNQGSRFILAHNHPSGKSDPSVQDIEITQDLLKASKLMNIQMLDHLVIVQNGYCSIRENDPSLWIGYDD